MKPEDGRSPSTATQMLAAAAALGVERLDAQLLLLHVLGRPSNDRTWLLAHDTDILADAVWPAFARLCARRVTGEPVAYLVGEKEFHGLGLQVDARVLVPRPDTETLVEWALQCLQGRTSPSVLDLGTGSGAIALAIQHARPDARVAAVDRSADALAVARANAQHLGLAVRFAEADWLEGADADLDLVVSNPPYVAVGDPHLAAWGRWCPGRTGWTTSAASWRTRPRTCATAAGCSSNTATTRRPRCAPCSCAAASPRCKAATTWQASRAARAGSGAR
jgi:release factor glutamine methyltransferase